MRIDARYSASALRDLLTHLGFLYYPYPGCLTFYKPGLARINELDRRCLSMIGTVGLAITFLILDVHFSLARSSDTADHAPKWIIEERKAKRRMVLRHKVRQVWQQALGFSTSAVPFHRLP